ncbi:hypothetical protein [Acinetobacter kanungonis]|uniref:hypothetical protein n=1 Tax=Acinetobacter kanungonis TaxID=2699469 RepID=UPI00137A6385|nr:hypothetical protein [Acinetobacter kanungonis]NCI78377.1 hypothetical protein [Acinetobacter kanungonis]
MKKILSGLILSLSALAMTGTAFAASTATDTKNPQTMQHDAAQHKEMNAKGCPPPPKGAQGKDRPQPPKDAQGKDRPQPPKDANGCPMPPKDMNAKDHPAAKAQ